MNDATSISYLSILNSILLDQLPRYPNVARARLVRRPEDGTIWIQMALDPVIISDAGDCLPDEDVVRLSSLYVASIMRRIAAVAKHAVVNATGGSGIRLREKQEGDSRG